MRPFNVSILTFVLLASPALAAGEVTPVPAKAAPPAGPSLAETMARSAQGAAWQDPLPLQREDLEKSLELSRAYLINNLDKDGRFRGDFEPAAPAGAGEAGKPKPPSPSRQGFGFYALALLAANRSNQPTREAFLLAANGFSSQNRQLSGNRLVPVFGEMANVDTALPALGLVSIAEFYERQGRQLQPEAERQLRILAAGYLETLRKQEHPEAGWGAALSLPDGQPNMRRNGFTDGLCLLAYCRAIRQMNLDPALGKRLEQTLPGLVADYTVHAWPANPASQESADFARFGAVALAEYSETPWPQAKLAGDACLSLAWFLIHNQGAGARAVNPADYLPPLLAAHRVALRRNDREAAAAIAAAVRPMLLRQMSMQLGHRRFGNGMPWDANLPVFPKEQEGGEMALASEEGIVRLPLSAGAVHGGLQALEQEEIVGK